MNPTGDNEDSPFFKTNTYSLKEMEVYGKKLKCPTKPLEMYGHYNSVLVANLMIVFERCDQSKREPG